MIYLCAGVLGFRDQSAFIASLPRVVVNPEPRKVGQNWQKPDSHLRQRPSA